MPGTATCGCAPSCDKAGAATATAVTLPIVWQRLVSGGETCPRCGSTQGAIERAVTTLTEVLRPVNIEPTLETIALDQATFEEAPSESNRIWIAGRPLEHWVGAQVSASHCRSVCGHNDCRTLEVDGARYEAIPETLIVKAGLAAASTLADCLTSIVVLAHSAERPQWRPTATGRKPEHAHCVGQVYITSSTRFPFGSAAAQLAIGRRRRRAPRRQDGDWRPAIARRGRCRPRRGRRPCSTASTA